MKLKYSPQRSNEHTKVFVTGSLDWLVEVKWDGCVHIFRYLNGSTANTFDESDVDYLHVCDLDEFAESLMELAQETKKFRETT